ncbi:MAG TPA: YitT family protein [Clostridiales bacterium]|nr:YitT family protein [Clostridiales bacterium]
MSKKIIKDTALIVLGSVIYALGVVAFIEPNQISPGGITGLSTLIFYLTGFPAGISYIILNIPLMIAGLKFFGFRFIAKTLFATIMTAVAIDLSILFVPAYTGNTILATLFGGVFIGCGMALILLRGATTGGTDILAKLVLRKYPFLSMGRVLLFIDIVIFAIASIVYCNFETALYSIIGLYTATKMIDSLLYGADSGKLIFIITRNSEKLTQEIFKVIGRGVTKLRAFGGYSQSETDMLMCAVRQTEAAKIHSIIKDCDPTAFVIVTEAPEIIGEGFKGLYN